MINKFKCLKKPLALLLLLVPLAIVAWGSSNLPNRGIKNNNESESFALVNNTPNVVVFKAGAIEESDVVLARCNAQTTYTIFGEIFNSRDRIVGLNSQNTVFNLRVGSTNFNIEPHADVCISYEVKKEFLRPNESTKAKFTITNAGTTASTWQLPNTFQREDFSINFDTNEATDGIVAARLQTISQNQSAISATGTALVGGANVASIDNTVDINDGVVRVAIGSLILLTLCPIAVLVGLYVYKRQPKNDQKK